MKSMKIKRDKQKIKIIRDLLKKYLETFSNRNCFYYAGLSEIDIYDKYLNNDELDKEEQEFINNMLNIDKVKFGKYEFDW